MSLVLLTGSRGYPDSLPKTEAAKSFRVAHRALPLTLVQELAALCPPCCDILAVGGGTVMDAAKAILAIQAKPARLTLIPTTFGTGAEVTRFATVYDREGHKLSLALPDSIKVETRYIPELLHSLPENEVQANLCDAFAHCFESLWARHATRESMLLAKAGLQSMNALLLTPAEVLRSQHASALLNFGRLAGHAIGISKTTAAHALSYELSQRFHIPHGYAVAVFLPSLHAACRQHQDACPELAFRLQLQAEALDLRDPGDVADFLQLFVERTIPAAISRQIRDFSELERQRPPCPIRLANFPLDYSMYKPVRLSSSKSSVAAAIA